MNNNNAPFYVGQRVVVVYGGTPKVPTGSVYSVKGLCQAKCGCWGVDIGFSTDVNANVHCTAHGNQSSYFIKGVRWCNSKYFAPIDERTISIPESLKEQAEEMIQVKETIHHPETQPA